MAFHQSKPSRMYAYACLPPIENSDLVDEQLRLANSYRNNLVENERRRREQIQQARRERFPQLADLETALAAIDEEIAAARTAMKAASAQARRRVKPAEQIAALADLRGRQKTLREQYRAAREAANTDADLLAAWDAIGTAANDEVRRLRAACRLAWGTYLVVEASVPHQGDAPRFQRFDGTGRIAVQLQATQPLTTDGIYQDRDQRLQLTALPDRTDAIREITGGQDLNHPLRDRWGKSDVALRLRIGTNENRRAIWATFPIVMHRPLPPGAAVKWVYLIRRKRATAFVWQAVFVLSRDAWPAKQPKEAQGAAGMDVGWRKVEQGLRVATWTSDDGQKGAIVIPEERLELWREVERIQSDRDIHFNAAKMRLATFLGGNAPLPEWMRAEAATLTHWRSPRRLAGYVLRWRDDRQLGDEAAFAALNGWRKRDKMAYQHQERLSLRNQRWRDQFYREALRDQGAGHRILYVEKLRVSDMRRVQQAEEDPNGVIVRYRNIAAIGRLLALAVEHFESNAVKVDAALTTITHAGCGHVNRGIDKRPQWLTCEWCDVAFDQDENAAANLLALGLAANSDETAARTA